MSGGRRCCVLLLVLAAAVLCAFFPKGVARNVELVRLGPRGYAFFEVSAADKGGQLAVSAMDYDEPGANTNPWAGWAIPSPPPTQS